MDLHDANDRILTPALGMLPSQLDTPAARVELLAIGLQESGFRNRFQVVQGRPDLKGPARSFWQMERGGGCAGVIRHKASRYWMHDICVARGVEFTPQALWLAIENDDILACAAARLLLFTDPFKLPEADNTAGGWDLYARVWRPGKPKPDTWPSYHQQALQEIAP
jgi:hypothetical protein